ncbi:MAG: D-alanine--D-alanine ligase [Bacteroidota bacterium]
MKTVGIFCGGYSSEFDISIKSAETIQKNFPKDYTTVKIIIKKEGWKAEVNGELFDFDSNSMSFGNKKIDIGLVYIHGDPGENGKIQALLDMKGIPYLNSGPLASALSFDKWFCNQFLKSFGIPVAKSILLTSSSTYSDEHIIQELGLPLFVKPADSGSSYGISKVKTKEELPPAIHSAFKEGKTVVIESFLNGTEVTCGVYRTTEGIVALPLTEIASENEFFDYDAKYLGKSQEITPARVSDEIKDKIQQKSKYIYELMQLRSIARIDFMVVDSEPFVIEVNTTPGFSPASIVPQMLTCAGISITDFWKNISEVEL